MTDAPASVARSTSAWRPALQRKPASSWNPSRSGGATEGSGAIRTGFGAGTYGFGFGFATGVGRAVTCRRACARAAFGVVEVFFAGGRAARCRVASPRGSASPAVGSGAGRAATVVEAARGAPYLPHATSMTTAVRHATPAQRSVKG